MAKKRKRSDSVLDDISKRSDKPNNVAGPSTSTKKIRKLAPPRPFPTVPTSVSATGPPSAHKEGKNMICITRRTPLGAYLRRCKDVIIKDGYKTLHLYALGAAIPHLSRLAVSLPLILPFPPDEVHTEIYTGTAELKDEVIPDDEDEDISIQTRGKSTMSVIIRIGDGNNGMQDSMKDTKTAKGKEKAHDEQSQRMQTKNTNEVVFQEEDLEDDSGSDEQDAADGDDD